MFDHVGVVVRDLGASAKLYARMLSPLGIHIVEKHRLAIDSAWVVFSTGKPQSPFLVLGEGKPSFWPRNAKPSLSPLHLCFTAPSSKAVDRFHAAAIAHGGTDNGGPGVRREPFYCAFVLDLDGNNVEAGYYPEGDR